MCLNQLLQTSLLTLCNVAVQCEFSLTDVVTDAIGIYSAYIALNALTPVYVPDDIRQRVEGMFI